MAQIDATGLATNFNAFLPDNIDHKTFITATPVSYVWQTTNSYYVTALGFSGDINAAQAGTVNAVNIVDGSYNPVLNITGLDLPLGSILDTASAGGMQQKFWNAVLTGDTTILVPTTMGKSLILMGDFVSVNIGQPMTGGDDIFTGNNAQGFGAFSGDAIQVGDLGVLHGGNDLFDGAVASLIIGDVGDGFLGNPTNYGTVFGGNDTVSVVDPNYTPELGIEYIIGDVEYNSINGVVHGGNDRITLLDIATVTEVEGDNQKTYGADTGGNDTIRIETTIAGRTFANATLVSGDDDTVDGSAKNFTSTGGDDFITLNNVDGSYVLGDFGDVTSARGIGGNDTISVNGTFPLTTPAPPYPITPNVSQVDGDAYSVIGTRPFSGGNDSISLSNVSNNNTSGDAYTVGSLPRFSGGNDTIAFSYDRTNSPGAFYAQGDAHDASSAVFNGGDNSIAANLAASLQSAPVYLNGDLNSYNAATDGEFHGGNDTLIANTAATQNAGLVGDAGSLSASNNLAAYGGNDSLRGGAGNDSLYGDWGSMPTHGGTLIEVGGNDTLDGRGGNDYIDGGDGNDTAKFSLKHSVYVDLNGIPGTAASPADYVEAIGQGNDQLVSIENIFGSSLGDVILGDAGKNVLQGLTGADRLGGRGDGDTLFGANGNDTLGGGNGADKLSGDAGNDSLSGGKGNDLLLGGAGADTLLGGDNSDTLTGGTGRDILEGGTGADHFVFKTLGNSTPDAQRDHIVDFAKGTDLIDVSGIDAKAGVAGNQAFHFITGAFTGTKGELHAVNSGANTIVSGDVSGDKHADFSIFVENVNNLHAGDFVL